MLQNKRLLPIAAAIFALAEGVLAVLIQLTSGNVNMWCSYAAVLLACAFLLLFFERTPAYIFTQLALGTTVCADYFLVLGGAEQKLAAMLFFSVTQLAYFLRLYLGDSHKKRRTVHVFLRIGISLFALLLTRIVLRDGADAVALVSMFYFANLLLNIVFAFWQFETSRLFAVGLLLFACCDVLIGISLIEAYLPLTEGSLLYHLAYPGFNAAWLFYVPAQTLLALSLLPRRLQQTQK